MFLKNLSMTLFKYWDCIAKLFLVSESHFICYFHYTPKTQLIYVLSALNEITHTQQIVCDLELFMLNVQSDV